MRILHVGSKAQDKGDSANHGLYESLCFGGLLGPQMEVSKKTGALLSTQIMRLLFENGTYKKDPQLTEAGTWFCFGGTAHGRGPLHRGRGRVAGAVPCPLPSAPRRLPWSTVDPMVPLYGPLTWNPYKPIIISCHYKPP